MNTTVYTHRGWLVFTVMMLAILEVLDSTIVNVALPSMMTSLGANQNQITWVLTSYVVASAIVLPLTGFLTNRLGRQQFLFICASGFMISSFLCGISTSLSEIVVFRVIQGLCGSSLIPISQTMLQEAFPPQERGKAMAIWGLGIMAAPVFGPTLGGFITEHSTWRWIFYINLPFCVIGLFLISWVIPKTKAIYQSINISSLLWMILGIGALQIFLDKGNEKSWFSSNSMLFLFVFAAFSLGMLIFRSLRQPRSIIRLNLYKDRNFLFCSLLILAYCGCIFSFITLQPIMLENYFGYSAIQAGMAMAPTGIASALGMMLSSQLLKHVRVNYILSVALAMGSIGLWHEYHVSLDAPMSYFAISNIFIGLGMGCFFVPLTTQVFATLPPQDIPDAAGLFSYARMLGTSIGVSLMSTFASQMTQISWHDLVGHINSFNSNLTYWLNQQHFSYLTPTAIARLNEVITLQAGMQGFISTFKLMFLLTLILIPIAFSLQKTPSLESKIHFVD